MKLLFRKEQRFFNNMMFNKHTVCLKFSLSLSTAEYGYTSLGDTNQPFFSTELLSANRIH